MVKIIFVILTCLFFNMAFAQFSKAEIKNEDKIIAIVNGEKLYLKDFKRLFEAQKKEFQSKYGFNFLASEANIQEILENRKQLLVKAKINALSITEDELNKAWIHEIKKQGGLEKLFSKVNDTNLTLEDLKNKVRENLLLEKYFKEKSKFKIVEHMIDELLIKQEAKERGIFVSEDTVSDRMNKIIEAEGGKEAFEAFLVKNNATIEDAKEEIKNQLTIELVKKMFASNLQTNENIEELFNSYIEKKKTNSSILVYSKNLFEDKNDKEIIPEEKIVAQADVNLRKVEYPTITKSRLHEINKLVHKETHDPKSSLSLKLLSSKLQKKLKTKEEPPLLTENELKALESSIKLRQEVSVEEFKEDEKLPDLAVKQVQESTVKENNPSFYAAHLSNKKSDEIKNKETPVKKPEVIEHVTDSSNLEWQINTDAIELGVELNKNDIVFISQKLAIGDKTNLEDFSFKQNFPILDNLTIPPNKKIYLELKCSNESDEYKSKLTTAVSDWINKNNLQNNAVVISFDAVCLSKVKNLASNIKTGLLAFDKIPNKKDDLTILKRIIDIEYLLPPFSKTSPQLLQVAKEAKLKVIPWVYKEDPEIEQDELTRIVALDVDGIITKQPEKFNEILKTNFFAKQEESKPQDKEVINSNPPHANNLTIDNTSSMTDFKKDLEELLKKIDTRRLTQIK